MERYDVLKCPWLLPWPTKLQLIFQPTFIVHYRTSIFAMFESLWVNKNGKPVTTEAVNFNLPGSRSDGSVSLLEMSPSNEVLRPSNDFFLRGRGDSESDRFGRFFGIKSGSGLKSELPSWRERWAAIFGYKIFALKF